MIYVFDSERFVVRFTFQEFIEKTQYTYKKAIKI